MGPLLIFLLSLYHLQTSINSEILSAAKGNANSFNSDDNDLEAVLLPPEIDTDLNLLDGNGFEDDDSMPAIRPSSERIPYMKSGRDQTDLDFSEPISSVSIDYGKNMIVLQFPKQRPRLHVKYSPDNEERERQFVENFMRFGRSSPDFMRLGKRQHEQYNSAVARETRGQEGVRDSRGDSFMRFGRANSKDFLRFGRDPKDFMRFGRAGGDFMRFGRTPKQDFMRFGRSQKMRRESDKNFMRLGRPDSFMRFGRASPPTDPNSEAANFMRFGRDIDKSFMRFGKSLSEGKVNNNTKEKDSDTESNPTDKAMKLFNKQQEDSADMSLETDYTQN